MAHFSNVAGRRTPPPMERPPMLQQRQAAPPPGPARAHMMMPAGPPLTQHAQRYVGGGYNHQARNLYTGNSSPGAPHMRDFHMNESGSMLGDSDGGGSGKGGHDMQAMPSLKVHGLASDIAQLENRCNWLEERNIWLTKRLLTAQRRFIEKTLLSSGKVKLQRSFEVWRDVMHELRLERQLEEQTRSLDQCQSVAKELGAALTQEQGMRSATETAHNDVKRDLQQGMSDQNDMKDAYKKGQQQLELLERRVHEAETCLIRSRAEAQNVIDTANAYERARRDHEDEAKFPNRPHNNPVEHSIKLREEAHGVMRNATTLLGNNQNNKHHRNTSPNRDS